MEKIILLLLITSVTCDSIKKKDANKKGYAFYYPLAMDARQLATVCLAIDKTHLPAQILVTFDRKTNNDVEPQVIESDYSCWQIKVPNATQNYDTTKIKVDIETKQETIKFTGEDEVRILKDEEQVFVETDRTVYKMGDTVKIRFLVLENNLKPKTDYKLKDVKIRSPYPTDAIIAQWDSISLDSGLEQLEFQLASDTPEGTWSISNDKFFKKFEVKKYVLPRFQVTVSGPDTLYINSESISFTICAKYSYGRNVKGNALLVAKVNYGYLTEPNSISKTKALMNGCAQFEFFANDLKIDDHYAWAIDLMGSVTEHGTDQMESGSKSVHITRHPFSYEWNSENRFIKPELPYKGKLSITQVNVPLDSATFELCYNILDINVCNNFTLDSSKNIDFTIPPLMSMLPDTNLIIEVKSVDYPSEYMPNMYFDLEVWNSTSSNSLSVDNIESTLQNCGSTLKFRATYNSENLEEGKDIDFKYILASRDEIISIGTILDKPKRQLLNLTNYTNIIGTEEYEIQNRIDTFNFEIDLDKKVYTEIKLVLYYFKDNNVISDYIRVDVKKCFPNKVEARWSEKQLYPGETGSLIIKADSKALCAVSSIDKASGFLGSNRDINVESVLGRFNKYTQIDKLNCIKPEEPETSENDTDFDTSYIDYFAKGFDSYEAFKDSSIGVISNLNFLSKVCDRRTTLSYPLGFTGSLEYTESINPEALVEETVVQTDDRGSDIRSFFPETWLWDLVTVEANGEIVLDQKLPDSITDWVGNVMCVSSKEGVGISNDIEIKGFKPFFVDILLPFSIKRNKEVLHLPIPIFNYLNHSLPVRVTLEPSEELVLVEGDAKRSFDICLDAEDSYTHIYRIKATKLGHVSITVSGNVDPVYDENCTSGNVIRRRDAVQRPVLVEPEGYPSGVAKGALLCANDSSGVNNISWTIELPENVVVDTIDGKVTINSDILGPMFQNFEKLLVIPTGCGEQTMATLTPNLYVLKYLESNKALIDNIKEKILKNLKLGYQRMLTYVHDDGSFSAFGKNDASGSMFLTAFVIRTFKQMKQYTFIDDDVLNKAINWVISHQLENGCFDPVQHPFHDLVAAGLASSKNQTTALTSYVLISFLETNTNINEKILSKSNECILKEDTPDKYTMAISSYALVLLNASKEAQKTLDKLLELSKHQDGLMWWEQSNNSMSANVEISSYALISLLRQDPLNNLGTGSSIVKWLQSQMNPRGGFYSTTDTVVGLDSISRYVSFVNTEEPNGKVSVKTNEITKDFMVTKRESTKPEIIPLNTYPNKIKANILGDGCISIQATVNYYLDKPVRADDLKLDIKLKPVKGEHKCSLVELKPCVSYVSPGQINMAIVEVGLPSGYAADQASLYELTANNVVMKFEQIKNQIVFYLTHLGSNEVCTPFIIEENLIVENIANATVNFYDYYKPEISVSKSFKLENCEGSLSKGV